MDTRIVPEAVIENSDVHLRLMSTGDSEASLLPETSGGIRVWGQTRFYESEGA